MTLKEVEIGQIRPYRNNPRDNERAVKDLCESIKQCGYIAPIIVDEDGVILAGHTRYKALKRLGYETCRVLVAEGMDDTQKKKYRLLDNKVGELADWDIDKLQAELQGLNFSGFGFDWGAEDFSDEEIEALMADEVQKRDTHKHRVIVDVETEAQTYQVQNLVEAAGYKCRVQNG